MKSWEFAVTALALITSAALLQGCESDESNDMAKAQDCLDHIGPSNFASANGCMEYIAKYDTQQSNILKCAIKFMAGGLTTPKIANAYKKIAEVGAASKEATFIATLALTPASAATDALPFCTRSELKGLIYLANLAVMGSMMSSAIGTGSYDPSDPTSIPSPADITNMMTQCQPPATCNGQHATVGASVITLSTSYCVGSNATTDVCTKINSAISGSGGDPTLVSKQLFCALDGKTFSTTPSEGCYP